MVCEDKLVRKGLDILKAEARRLWYQLGGQVSLDELEEFGYLPLVLLVRKYNPQESPFEIYLSQRLRWAIIDEVRRWTHSRCAAAARWWLIPKYNLRGVLIENPEQIAIRLEGARNIRVAVDNLPFYQKELIRRHYFNNERFDHIAVGFGKSKFWACRQHFKALNNLEDKID